MSPQHFYPTIDVPMINTVDAQEKVLEFLLALEHDEQKIFLNNLVKKLVQIHTERVQEMEKDIAQRKNAYTELGYHIDHLTEHFKTA